jgi:hypothetical protein
VYYVGGKEERTRQYLQEVAPMSFNILVTTYEYIMRDRWVGGWGSVGVGCGGASMVGL